MNVLLTMLNLRTASAIKDVNIRLINLPRSSFTPQKSSYVLFLYTYALVEVKFLFFGTPFGCSISIGLVVWVDRKPIHVINSSS